MLFITYFTELGVPKTGLIPKIDVWDAADNSHDVNNQNMTEIDGGFYSYEFAGYDATKDYVVRCDGTSALPVDERYSYYTSGDQKATDDLATTLGSPADTDIATDIVNVQTVVDSNATLIARILGLSQENFVMSATTYVNNKLTVATIKTYPTHADADADTNEIAEYEVTASYDGNGDCDAYKVVKV